MLECHSQGLRRGRRASSGLNADAQKIQNEPIVYSAAKRLDTPRGWAICFGQFLTGRLRQSAFPREENALLCDMRARVYGRYYSAADGETMNAGMRRAGLDLIAMPAERARQMQWALQSRGSTIGAVDGQVSRDDGPTIGPGRTGSGQ
ncbi:hypothetical protein LCL97_04755 [Seohaeicola saemankumensis]|nr:hypothetical protein [Seohaeicola saemankumensis]MCA0870120.1 hypothetical protein [Seohaeicola saemankumensis]